MINKRIILLELAWTMYVQDSKARNFSKITSKHYLRTYKQIDDDILSDLHVIRNFSNNIGVHSDVQLTVMYDNNESITYYGAI